MQIRQILSKFLLLSSRPSSHFSSIPHKTFLKQLTAYENQIYLSWIDENYEECLSLRLKQMKLKQSFYNEEFYAGFSEDCCKIGVLYNELSDDVSALAYFSQGLQRTSRENHAIYADLLHNTGVSLLNQGNLAKAAELLQEAKTLKKTRYNSQEDGLSLGTLCSNLARVYKEQQDFFRAKENFLESVEFFQHSRDNFPKETALNLAEVFEELASIFFKEKDFISAENFSQKAGKLYAETVGERHLLAIKSLCNTAGMLLARKKFKKTAEILRKVENFLGKPDEISWTLHNLANLLNARLSAETRRFGEAKEFLQKAEKNLENFQVEDLSQKHAVFLEKCKLLAEMREFEEAFEFSQKCLRLNASLFAENNEAKPQIFAVSAECLLFFGGKLEEAGSFLQKAREIAGNNEEFDAVFCKLYGILLKTRGETRKAAEFLRKSGEILRKSRETSFLQLVEVEFLRNQWVFCEKSEKIGGILEEDARISLKNCVLDIDFAIESVKNEGVPEIVKELLEKRQKIAEILGKYEGN